MTTRRFYFTIRDEAHRKMRCARCGSLMASGETAVTVVEPGHTYAEHDDECPPPRPMRDPHKRVIQGSKP